MTGGGIGRFASRKGKSSNSTNSSNKNDTSNSYQNPSSSSNPNAGTTTTNIMTSDNSSSFIAAPTTNESKKDSDTNPATKTTENNYNELAVDDVNMTLNMFGNNHTPYDNNILAIHEDKNGSRPATSGSNIFNSLNDIMDIDMVDFENENNDHHYDHENNTIVEHHDGTTTTGDDDDGGGGIQHFNEMVNFDSFHDLESSFYHHHDKHHHQQQINYFNDNSNNNKNNTTASDDYVNNNTADDNAVNQNEDISHNNTNIQTNGLDNEDEKINNNYEEKQDNETMNSTTNNNATNADGSTSGKTVHTPVTGAKDNDEIAKVVVKPSTPPTMREPTTKSFDAKSFQSVSSGTSNYIDENTNSNKDDILNKDHNQKCNSKTINEEEGRVEPTARAVQQHQEDDEEVNNMKVGPPPEKLTTDSSLEVTVDDNYTCNNVNTNAAPTSNDNGVVHNEMIQDASNYKNKEDYQKKDELESSITTITEPRPANKTFASELVHSKDSEFTLETEPVRNEHSNQQDNKPPQDMNPNHQIELSNGSLDASYGIAASENDAIGRRSDDHDNNFTIQNIENDSSKNINQKLNEGMMIDQTALEVKISTHTSVDEAKWKNENNVATTQQGHMIYDEKLSVSHDRVMSLQFRRSNNEGRDIETVKNNSGGQGYIRLVAEERLCSTNCESETLHQKSRSLNNEKHFSNEPSSNAMVDANHSNKPSGGYEKNLKMDANPLKRNYPFSRRQGHEVLQLTKELLSKKIKAPPTAVVNKDASSDLTVNNEISPLTLHHNPVTPSPSIMKRQQKDFNSTTLSCKHLTPPNKSKPTTSNAKRKEDNVVTDYLPSKDHPIENNQAREYVMATPFLSSGGSSAKITPGPNERNRSSGTNSNHQIEDLSFDDLLSKFQQDLVDSADTRKQSDNQLVDLRVQLCVSDNVALRLHACFDDLLQDIEGAMGE